MKYKNLITDLIISACALGNKTFLSNAFIITMSYDVVKVTTIRHNMAIINNVKSPKNKGTFPKDVPIIPKSGCDFKQSLLCDFTIFF